MHNLAETIFNEFSELGQFLAQNLGFYDENPGFFGFFRFVTNFEQLEKKIYKSNFKNFICFEKLPI